MSSEGATENVGQKPGYIFELGADLGCGRTFSIRGNFAVGAAIDDMHREMDKLIRVCDRQLSKAVIPAIEKKLREEEFALETFRRNLKSVQEQQSGHKSLPATAKANLDNAQSNVERQEAVIKEQKALLDRTKADAA